MGFAPFQALKSFGQTWLPNAANTAPAVAVPQAPAAGPVPPAAIPAPGAVAAPTPVLSVTPTTPVLASAPTAPIVGRVSTPQADIGSRTLNTGWQGSLSALIVQALGFFGIKTGPFFVKAIGVILMMISAFVFHTLKHKAAAKP